MLTDILHYVPTIPSICCAAAHPHLRYARETVAGTRAERVEQHRGDLHVCWDWTTNREYHSFSGSEGDLSSDLVMMGWWLSRPFLDNGEPMILEVNVKKQAAAVRAATDPNGNLESLLRILTSPPYQLVEAGTSCLRSLIFTPNRLAVTPAVLELIGKLTHLEKLECFSQALALPLPALASVYVLKLRNVKSLTSLEPILPLSRLRKLSLCRCSELHSIAALAALPELTEVRLANCRLLDLQGDYRACRQLTSFSMRWCREVLHCGDLATLPNLCELDCSYCGLKDVERLVGCGKLRRLCLRGCQTIHELFPIHEEENDGAESLLSAASTPGAAAAARAAVRLVDHPLLLPRALSDSSDVAALPSPPLSATSASSLSFSLPNSASTTAAATDANGSLALTLSQLEELDAGESSLASLSGVAHCAPELRHLTVRECKHLHSLSPLGTLSTLTSVDASFSGVNELQGLSVSHSLEYVNLKNCTELRSVAPLAKVQSLREVDLSVLSHNCIICIDDPVKLMEEEEKALLLRRRRSAELVVLSAPVQPTSAEESVMDTAVTQRSAFGMSQHHIVRKDAEKLLTQPLAELRLSEAGSTASVY